MCSWSCGWRVVSLALPRRNRRTGDCRKRLAIAWSKASTWIGDVTAVDSTQQQEDESVEKVHVGTDEIDKHDTSEDAE